MRYWIYLGGEVPGQYDAKELVTLPGFTENALVCPCEGELSDRKWQPASAITEIAKAIGSLPPSPPAQALRASHVLGPDQIVDETNIKLFRHVSRLMKELEARRSDKALVETLRSNLAHTEEELQEAQKALKLAKDKEDKIKEVEERADELESHLAKARKDANDRSKDVDDLRARLEQQERDLATVRANLSAMDGEKRAVDERLAELNRSLAEKELSLTKSIAALSRVEKELGQLANGETPAPAAPKPSSTNGKAPPAELPPPVPSESLASLATPSPEPPRADPPPPVPVAESMLASYVNEDPAPAPPPLAPMPVKAEEPEPLHMDTSIHSELADIFKKPEPRRATLRIDDTAPPPMPPEEPVVEIAPPWREALDQKLAALKAKFFGRK